MPEASLPTGLETARAVVGITGAAMTGVAGVSVVVNGVLFWDELGAFWDELAATPDGLSAANPNGSTKFSGSFPT